MDNPIIIWPKNKKYRIFISVILLAFIVVTLTKAYHYVKDYGGCDLRTRVTGTRLLGTNQSPYFYFWKPGDNERYLAPGNKQGELANGNVVTPAAMASLYPIYNLPYKYVRWLWALLETGFAVASIVLLAKTAKTKNFYPVALVIAGLLCSDIFLAEIERGQMYLGYCFSFSFLYYLYQKKEKKYQVISGLLAALFIFFRLFAGIIIVPFLLAKEWDWLKGWMGGLALGFLLLVLPIQKYWWQYFDAMDKYKQMYFDKIPLQLTANNFSYPQVIEGMYNLTKVKGFNVYVLGTAVDFFNFIGVNPCIELLYGIFLILIVLLSYFFIKAHQKIKPEAPHLFLFAFGLYILAEIFSPSVRAGYNGIQWLFPLLLLTLNTVVSRLQLLLLIFCFMLFHNFPIAFSKYMQAGEFLLLAIIFKSCCNKKPLYPV